jgi:hypothetical protein
VRAVPSRGRTVLRTVLGVVTETAIAVPSSALKTP